MNASEISENVVLMILSVVSQFFLVFFFNELFQTALIGMATNFANIYTTIKSPILHNAFGYLCASQSFAEILNLLISSFWTVFVTIIDKKLATSFFGYKLGQIAFGVCLVVSYTVLVKAINRYFAISYPLMYRRIFSNENSKLIIFAIWILGFLHFCIGFFGQFFFSFFKKK